MPEITEKPDTKIVSFVEKHPEIPGLYRQAIRPHEDLSPSDYKEIQMRITGRINQLKEALPRESEDAIDAFARLIYGPWLLSEEMLKRGTNEQAQKELSAQTQHLFVHSIFTGSGEGSSENYRKNLYFQVLELEKSAQMEIGRDFNLPEFINGIKSELAIIKTLTNSGYKVVIPEYLKKSDTKTGTRSETLEWDVESGVDLVAVAPDGTIFLIDAKGEKYYLNNESRRPTEDDIRTKVDFRIKDEEVRRLPQSLQDVVSNLFKDTGREILNIKRGEIIVPTDKSEMKTLGTKGNSNSYGEALGRFGELKDEHQQTIILTLGAV